MANDAFSLMSQGTCYSCYGNISAAQMMRLSLLANIAQQYNPAMDVSPQTLLDQGKCYNCFGDGLSAADIMELALLANISNAIAGGGGGGGVGAPLLGTTANPNGSVLSQYAGQFYTNTSGSTLWQAYSVSNNDWHQWI